jgi:integrase
MTVTAWFEYWISDIKEGKTKQNTMKMFKSRFEYNIEPVIGKMLMQDVKPMNCQKVLTNMAEKYGNSTIRLARCTMKSMFDDAVENDIILKNPVTSSVKCSSGKKAKVKRAFTIDEQKKFIKTCENMDFYNQFIFILQTGLRVGELSGLKWSDIDFNRRMLHVQRSANYDDKSKDWIVGATKSSSGDREIYLTDEAMRILQKQNAKETNTKVIDMRFKDNVFIGNNGLPIRHDTYDASIKRICTKAGIECNGFSMHTLRHTFATRCIEAGMKPKTLQTLLGHAGISTTMNLYVHTTDDEKINEIEKVEESLKVV